MYSSFTSLDALKDSAFRIFDPFAYRLVNEIRMVPVGLSEATSLARLFPIVWVPNLVGALQPVVVLRLQPSTRHPLPPPGAGLLSLPQLLQAYPFRVRDLDAGDLEIGIERILPERERDSGSYVIDGAGDLMPGARLKLRALELFLEGQDVLRDLTLRLQENGLFEPVRIPEGYSVSPPLPDMFAALETFDINALLQGVLPLNVQPATAFLVAQRMSLYRMHRLLQTLRVEDA